MEVAAAQALVTAVAMVQVAQALAVVEELVET